MRWYVYEDSKADDLAPLTLARPVFEVVCGRESLRRRLQRWFPTATWGASIRPWLAATYREAHSSAVVNEPDRFRDQHTFYVNGRWVPDARPTAEDVTENSVGLVNGEVAWMLISPEEALAINEHDLLTSLAAIAQGRRVVEASGILLARPWDAVNRNGRQLELDFHDEGVSQLVTSPDVRILGPASDVYIAADALLDPFVVIDAREGPVSIDSEVHVQSFTRIAGPCHIGKRSRIFRALISGNTTIGADCRVGGEVEESILHGYVNKYHEGFLGHSYVCPWVNLGAITSTSDLKSDYSSVRVPLSGELVDSGTNKVGSFIGDHTKTAIDSMFNTGTAIGVMAMVLPGGRLLPRHIPSFSNVSFGELAADWPLEKSLETARVAMSRRGCEFTAAQEALMRELHRRTSEERSTALDQAERKKLVRGR